MWQQLELVSELECDLQDTVDWGSKWLADFKAGKTQLVSFDQSKSALLMWKWMGLLFRKNHFSRCWVWLSLLHWIGALILSLLLNLSPRKLESWFVLWSFLLLRLLCISINLLCGHVWAGGPVWACAFVKLQKRICRIVGPLLAASYELLAHHWNVASLSLFL